MGMFVGLFQQLDVLIIGERATVDAEIKAGEIQIYGKVSGNIDCAGRVEICETGHVRGDIRTPKLIIKEGAHLRRYESCRDSGTRKQPLAVQATAASIAPLSIPS